MQRRQFVILLGGTSAALPLAARAQQPAVPVIGYLTSRSAEAERSMLLAVRRGLAEGGFVEGRNLAIEYRFADGQYDRQTDMVSSVVGRRVAAIVYGGMGVLPAAGIQELRASQIPVVFNVGGDPVRLGLVASINRPGGSMTGIWSLVGDLTGKMFGLLHELVPDAKNIAMLMGPSGGTRDAFDAAATLGQRVRIVEAVSNSDIEGAFAALRDHSTHAVIVRTGPFLLTHAKQIVALAARHRVPVIYGRRDYVEAGGLMSYNYDVGEGYRQMGQYTARILKGAKPGDLPVMLPTKFEMVINLGTAKTLGIEISPKLLALADEVIE